MIYVNVTGSRILTFESNVRSRIEDALPDSFYSLVEIFTFPNSRRKEN